MGKLAARVLIGIGVLHLLLFLWFGRRVLVAIASEGFWDTIDPIRDRQMIFWALMTGVVGLLLANWRTGWRDTGSGSRRFWAGN